MRTPRPGPAAALLLAAALLTGACAGNAPMPPVTPAPTNQHLTGKFVWHDLFTADPAAAEAFYGGLLGWRFQDVAEMPNYRLAMLDGRPVAGIVRAPAAKPGVWLNHLSVPDVDAAAVAITGRGGEVVLTPTDYPGRGRVAIVRDQLGALVALTRTANGDPADVLAPVNAIFWTELWAHDPPAHIAVYRELLGYEIDSRAMGEGTYTVLARDGQPRAGAVKNPWGDVPAAWLPYVRVTDPMGYARRARDLGATVLLAPSEAVRGGTAGLLVDPVGAPFVIQQWPLPDAEGGSR